MDLSIVYIPFKNSKLIDLKELGVILTLYLLHRTIEPFCDLSPFVLIQIIASRSNKVLFSITWISTGPPIGNLIWSPLSWELLRAIWEHSESDLINKQTVCVYTLNSRKSISCIMLGLFSFMKYVMFHLLIFDCIELDHINIIDQ